MYFLKINNTVMPAPYEYSVSYKDINSPDTERSDETGVMHRNRIRQGVVSCEAKWRIRGDSTAVLGGGLSGQVLDVSLLDPSQNSYRNCDMYVESFDCTFYQQQNSSETESYWEIECRLTEF